MEILSNHKKNKDKAIKVRLKSSNASSMAFSKRNDVDSPKNGTQPIEDYSESSQTSQSDSQDPRTNWIQNLIYGHIYF